MDPKNCFLEDLEDIYKNIWQFCFYNELINKITALTLHQANL